MSLTAIALAATIQSSDAGQVRSFSAFTAPANATLVVMALVRDGTAMSPTYPTITGGGLTWTKDSRNFNDGIHSAHLFTATVGDSDVAATVSIDCGTVLNGFVGAAMVARNENVGITVRQRRAVASTTSPPTFAFVSSVDSGNAVIVGFAGDRNPPGYTEPAGWTELLDTGITGAEPVGMAIAYRAAGASGASFAFGGTTAPGVGLGVELVTPSCACTMADPNYTAGTFDLFMAPINDHGAVGTEELVGNIATGTFADDAEPVDCFDPLANIEEPIVITIRQSERLQFVTDEVTCENLERFLNLAGVNSVDGTTMGVDAVVRPPMYQVTLEHTMPCGHIITRRFHRAAVVSRASWLFSPGSWHGLPFELRSYPDDRQGNVYGYWTITPGTCGASSS